MKIVLDVIEQQVEVGDLVISDCDQPYIFEFGEDDAPADDSWLVLQKKGGKANAILLEDGVTYDLLPSKTDIRPSNTQILCWVLGWQGGTVHQVAEELFKGLVLKRGIAQLFIIDAGYEALGWLVRQAQWQKNGGGDGRSPVIIPQLADLVREYQRKTEENHS